MLAHMRSWRERNEWIVGLLERRTGEGVDAWNARIRPRGFTDEASLRAWLDEQGVTGYPQMLLVFETFGYPDYLQKEADELLDGQYADRPDLRPIYEAVMTRVAGLGDVNVQARKTYVSLLTPRRTFAAVQATTKKRVDVGLRLDGQMPEGRLESAASMGQSAVTVRIGLGSVDEVDDEFAAWLRKAYEANT